MATLRVDPGAIQWSRDHSINPKNKVLWLQKVLWQAGICSTPLDGQAHECTHGDQHKYFAHTATRRYLWYFARNERHRRTFYRRFGFTNVLGRFVSTIADKPLKYT
eukprot:1195914-Prorocentrum_minimum.AAC.2